MIPVYLFSLNFFFTGIYLIGSGSTNNIFFNLTHLPYSVHPLIYLGLLPGSGRSVGWVPTAPDLNLNGLEQRFVHLLKKQCHKIFLQIFLNKLIGSLVFV